MLKHVIYIIQAAVAAAWMGNSRDPLILHLKKKLHPPLRVPGTAGFDGVCDRIFA
jgi:hypothetical protein